MRLSPFRHPHVAPARLQGCRCFGTKAGETSLARSSAEATNMEPMDGICGWGEKGRKKVDLGSYLKNTIPTFRELQK